MREKGIDYKEVHYLVRVRDSVEGSHFLLTHKRTVCNPKGRVKFYLKVGGIAFMQSKKVEGRKKSMIAANVKVSLYFGSYLLYTARDSKLRTITYCRKRLASRKACDWSRNSDQCYTQVWIFRPCHYWYENTSVLMIDETEYDVCNDLFKFRNYTVLQSGAFV